MNRLQRIINCMPTFFFLRNKESLMQLIHVLVENDGEPTEGQIKTKIGATSFITDLARIVGGESRHDVYVPENSEPVIAEFSLIINGNDIDRKSVTLVPQKHWQVYLIHFSHHDIGYTNLPSNIFLDYKQFYEDVVKYCKETDKFSDESKFRYTVEESCTLINYLQKSDEKTRAELIKYVREGRVEVAALYANLISEICGHEEIIRSLYPSFCLKREYGVKISSAMHNDVPGASWSFASILPEAGVNYFFAGIPAWYFGKKLEEGILPSTDFEVHTLWDESKVLPMDIPGAFRWQGPDGNRVLFWYDLHGTGEQYVWGYEQLLSDISEKIAHLQERDYPFDFVRYTVRGGQSDNAGPSVNISYIVQQWNQRWAYPKIIMGTNQLFIEQLKSHVEKLPVLRGELPSTDYTIGAISGAKETGLNRITHDLLLSAEKYATLSSSIGDYPYPRRTIEEAYKNCLLYDEHCFGMHHPVGPAQAGDWSEKGTFAYKASALTHDILIKSSNALADEISLDGDGLHIVIFNPLSFDRTDVVSMPFKEASPCDFPMHSEYTEKYGYTKNVPGNAIGRKLIDLPVELSTKPYDLIDVQTNESIPYQIHEIINSQEPSPYSTERYSLGHCSRVEKLSLLFIAKDVPSFGYKTYRLVPQDRDNAFKNDISIHDTDIENPFYKVSLDPKNGTVKSIFDKELHRELIDPKAIHAFNQLITRWSHNHEVNTSMKSEISSGMAGPICGSLLVRSNIIGCPEVNQEIILYSDLKKIDFRTRILRDATPFLEAYFSFPFSVEEPSFIYEGTNSVIEPLKDQIPGSNTDYYAMQHWASINNSTWGITFTSLEAPVVEFGGLWPGYVSGAHHSITPPEYGHDFRKENERMKSHIYSYIMNNNFRTNFKNTQVSDSIFRYSITSYKKKDIPINASHFGWAGHNPLIPVCILGRKKGRLPSFYGFCQIGEPSVILLNLKRAEDDQGIILRLLEVSGTSRDTNVTLPNFKIARAYQTNIVEENEKIIQSTINTFKVSIKGFGIVTVRILT
jgi:alpha-mannosidase